MFTITSVEVVNFRNLEHVVIEPEPGQKITALNGPSGSGKSSIVHAVVWALYGVMPPGVNQGELRRQGTSGANKDECRVTVTLTHAGDIITVTRELRGKNDTPQASVVVNDTAVTGLKAAAAVDWVTARLDLTHQGFLTAYVVRQKELDDLVTDVPAKRRESIERLAGITHLASAVEKVRASARTLHARLETMPGSEDDVTAAEDHLAEQELEAANAHETADAQDTAATDAESKATETETTYEKITQQWAADEKIRQAAKDADSDVKVAQAKAQTAQQELTALTAAAAGGTAEELAAATDAWTRAKTALSDAQTQNTRIAEATTRVATTKNTLDTTTDHAMKAREQAEQAAQEHQKALTAVAGFPADLDDQVSQAKKDAIAASERLGEITAEGTRLREAIDTLQTAADRSCPTCAQPLTDPDGLIAQFQRDRETLLDKHRTATANQETTQQAFTVLTGQAAQRDRAVTLAEQADKHATEAAKTATAADEALTTAKDAHQQALDDLDAAGQPIDLDPLLTAVSEQQSIMTAATKAADAQRELPAAEENAQAKQDEYTQAVAAAQQARAAADALTLTAQHVNDAHTAAQQARQLAQNLRAAHAQAVAQVTVQDNAVTAAKQALDRATAAVALRAAAAQEAENSAILVSAAEAYREARYIALLPELAQATTDLLFDMTDGRYVAVNFDESFTPVVTDDQGEDRKVPMLSGGEQSVVALAMRLGIGRIIAGAATEEGILALDEVLSAQDPDRRQSVLSAIRGLGGRQILMINHLPEAVDMADKAYGFSLTESGAGTAEIIDGGTVSLDLAG